MQSTIDKQIQSTQDCNVPTWLLVMLKLPSFADESFVDDCCVIELVVHVSCIGMQILSRLRAPGRDAHHATKESNTYPSLPRISNTPVIQEHTHIHKQQYTTNWMGIEWRFVRSWLLWHISNLPDHLWFYWCIENQRLNNTIIKKLKIKLSMMPSIFYLLYDIFLRVRNNFSEEVFDLWMMCYVKKKRRWDGMRPSLTFFRFF